MVTCQPAQPLRTKSWRISARFAKASSIEPSISFKHRVPKPKERPDGRCRSLPVFEGAAAADLRRRIAADCRHLWSGSLICLQVTDIVAMVNRSEERRVGKECRS